MGKGSSACPPALRRGPNVLGTGAALTTAAATGHECRREHPRRLQQGANLHRTHVSCPADALKISPDLSAYATLTKL